MEKYPCNVKLALMPLRGGGFYLIFGENIHDQDKNV
jgi:hypothetical protein